ncbi:MAG TPA: hypothetical protein VEJ86_13075 [Candidatus Binataceae bacterium]|nr:hypothetical protein [Candidatus Binataceae bacterium]
MAQARLRSSFIYLANAVNDLRGNWALLAAMLAPLVLASSLALLPESVNIQHRLAQAIEGGGQSISFVPAQTRMMPDVSKPSESDVFPQWSIYVLNAVGLVFAIAVGLVVLVGLARMRAGERTRNLIGEVIEVYRRSIRLAPSFFWIAFLQLIAPLIAGLSLAFGVTTDEPWLFASVNVGRFALLVFAAIVYLWLYFAKYALIFNGHKSLHALLFSRDLLRHRFVAVALRIAVFLALWSGYNSWSFGGLFFVSRLLGSAAAAAGFVWTTVMFLNLVGVGISYATVAFFIAASLRLYEDLGGLLTSQVAVPPSTDAAMSATAPLASSQG